MDDDSQNEGASAPGANAENINEQKVLNIPNGKEFQTEISVLDISLHEFEQYLNGYSIYFSTQKRNLMKEINNYRDMFISQYNIFKEKHSNSQKPSKYENESEFINAIEININLMKRINKIYSQIYDSIKQNMEVLNKFFDKFIKYFHNFDDISNKDKPVQDFLEEEFQNIVKSWLFTKIDFDKFNFENALSKDEYEPNFRTFVENELKKKNSKLDNMNPKGETPEPKEQIIIKEQKDQDIISLSESKSNLVKLHIKSTGQLASYMNDKLEYSNLKKLYIENSEISNPHFDKKMKNLEKLVIKLYPSFQYDIIEYLPEKLKELHLEKNNLVNFEVDGIFKGVLSNNKNILENLEYISFAGNNITRVDLSIIPSKVVFVGLQSMNFQKNKIYKFIFNPENFKNLKFINCCKNNLNKSYLSNLKNLASLETGNGFLTEPELCEDYYNKLKEKLKINENELFITKHLNITFIPKLKSLKYFEDFIIHQKIIQNLKKLDLSYNSLNCDTFFKFVNQNNGFPNVRSLNLNGNEIDDTFFEKFLDLNAFPKLKHLYLNSNKIGDTKIEVQYKDEKPIDEKYNSDNDRNLIYKLRLLYKFIQKNIHLNKLTITKNPISEFYSVVPDKNNNAYKSSKYITKENNIIIINCLFSLLIKIRDELLTKEEEKITGRKRFNLRFDCRSNVNRNSENYPYESIPIVKK